MLLQSFPLISLIFYISFFFYFNLKDETKPNPNLIRANSLATGNKVNTGPLNPIETKPGGRTRGTKSVQRGQSISEMLGETSGITRVIEEGEDDDEQPIKRPKSSSVGGRRGSRRRSSSKASSGRRQSIAEMLGFGKKD